VRLKTEFVVFVCILGILSSASFSMDNDEYRWKPMGTLTEQQRQERLIKEFYNSAEDSADILTDFAGGKADLCAVEMAFIPGIHTLTLPEYGKAFSFDGTIDMEFCNELKKS
jgi:hypothetical protein